MTFPAFASLLPIATHDEYLLLPRAVFTVIALIPLNLDLFISILILFRQSGVTLSSRFRPFSPSFLDRDSWATMTSGSLVRSESGNKNYFASVRFAFIFSFFSM